MKPFDYYKTQKTTYPRSSDYKTTYYYKNRKLFATVKNDIIFYEDGCSGELPKVKEVVTDEVGYKEHFNRYHLEGNVLYEEFVNDLCKDLGIESNPKKGLLLSKAYDIGHSSGYSGIYNAALDLVDLIM